MADFDALAAGEFRKALVLYMRRAESLEVLGRDEDAERDWTRALDEDAGNPWLLHRRALARARLGRTREAVEDLTRALAAAEGEPVDAELLRDRGSCARAWGTWRGRGRTSRRDGPRCARGTPPSWWKHCAAGSGRWPDALQGAGTHAPGHSLLMAPRRRAPRLPPEPRPLPSASSCP
ncbi:tetratricopeptide repeat protein [Cystobacter fuscus]